jgi:hypothetical protein
MTDVALLNHGTDDDPNLVAHSLTCRVVQDHRKRGLAIFNLFEIQNPLPANINRHSCLEPNG